MMDKKNTKFSEKDKLAVVCLLKSSKERKEIAKFYGKDPTAIDKIRSAMDSNPDFPYVKWNNISDEQKRDLCKKIESGEMSLTSVINGWSVSRSTIERFWGTLVINSEQQNKNKETSLKYLETLKVVVKNCKKECSKLLGEKADIILLKAVIDALYQED